MLIKDVRAGSIFIVAELLGGSWESRRWVGSTTCSGEWPWLGSVVPYIWLSLLQLGLLAMVAGVSIGETLVYVGDWWSV